MVYLIASFLYFLKNKFSIHSIPTLLFSMLVFSTIAAYLTGRLLDLPATYFFYELYIGVMLYILFSSWNNYSNVKGYDFSDINEQKLRKVERVIVWVNGFVFLVDLIVFIAVFSLLVAGVIHVTEFKNAGDSDLRQSVISSVVPSIIMTFSFLFSPLGYLSLALHFYYLVKRNTKRAVLHLVLSLTIILIGVIGLSRSALVNYVLVYSISFLFIVPLLSKKLLKKSIVVILIFGGAIGYVFSTISEDRFGESFYIESTSIINEKEYPELVSFLDYFSQWVYFGPKLMERYNGPSDLFWGKYNSSAILVAIDQKVRGTSVANEAQRRKVNRILGDTASAFHGCVVRTIFDFGYIGTFLFILLNGFINKKMGPDKKKNIRFKTLLAMPLLLPFSIGFFSGSSYSQLNINLAMIYMWLIYLYCRNKAPKTVVNRTIPSKTELTAF